MARFRRDLELDELPAVAEQCEVGTAFRLLSQQLDRVVADERNDGQRVMVRVVVALEGPDGRGQLERLGVAERAVNRWPLLEGPRASKYARLSGVFEQLSRSARALVELNGAGPEPPGVELGLVGTTVVLQREQHLRYTLAKRAEDVLDLLSVYSVLRAKELEAAVPPPPQRQVYWLRRQVDEWLYVQATSAEEAVAAGKALPYACWVQNHDGGADPVQEAWPLGEASTFGVPVYVIESTTPLRYRVQPMKSSGPGPSGPPEEPAQSEEKEGMHAAQQ